MLVIYNCKHTAQNEQLRSNIVRASTTIITFVHDKCICYLKNDVRKCTRSTFVRFVVLLITTQHDRWSCWWCNILCTPYPGVCATFPCIHTYKLCSMSYGVGSTNVHVIQIYLSLCKFPHSHCTCYTRILKTYHNIQKLFLTCYTFPVAFTHFCNYMNNTLKQKV